MAFAFSFLGGGEIEEDEIALGQPDEMEAKSLPLHVGKCARRYRVTVRRLNRLEKLMIMFFIVQMAINPSVWDFIKGLL
jgi:hypothetical protein